MVFPSLDGLLDASFSADGKRLLCSRERRYTNLWVVDVGDGSGGSKPTAQQLTGTTSLKALPRYSTDGRALAFSMQRADGFNIYSMSIDGGSPRQLTFMADAWGSPAWSSDGGHIAFGAKHQGDPRIWTVSLEDGSLRRYDSTSPALSYLVIWSPGGQIAYQQPGRHNFRVLDPATEDEGFLVGDDSVGYVLAARYSPSGKQVAVRWSGPRQGLWVLSLESGRREAAAAQGDVWPIGWSADGAQVYAFHSGQSLILAIRIAAGQTDTVLSLPFEAIAPGDVDVSPDATQVVAAVPETQFDIWLLENFDQPRR
jgi:dipeptidyl aminopeptidase/acylaminoacyl peptidase